MRNKKLSWSVFPIVSLLLMENALSANLQFQEISAALSNEEKHQVRTTSNVRIDQKEYAVSYTTLLRTADTLQSNLNDYKNWGKNIFGALVDVNGNFVLQEDRTPRISNYVDFSSLLNLGDKGLWMISNFESRPGAMYLTRLQQQKDNGKLTAVATRPIDFSGVNGGVTHCAGMVTPWQSHLTGEEYEPDARQWADNKISKSNAAIANYFGKGSDPKERVNPYDYGWPVEVKVTNARGDTEVVKHYAMARVSIELPYLMPDNKTVYLSDDGSNVGFYLFVAKDAGDLSAGYLYAARWIQTTDKNAGGASLEWISLGFATNAKIKTVLEAGVGFNDIFFSADSENGQCPPEFISINTGHGTPKHECLKIKPGMASIASRLETRRYAAMRGATTEFTKLEGMTFNSVNNTLYLAMSEVNKGMEDANENYDKGGANHIRLKANDCGAVYRLTVGNDSDIGSHYVAKNLEAEIIGTEVNGSDKKNICAQNNVANPDNLTFLNGFNTLIIGEDSGTGHQNDMLWAYDLNHKKLTRIQTSPYGAEITSPYWYSDINGWSYLLSVVQHPYGETDQDKLQPESTNERAYVGYIGPIPVTNIRR